MKYVKKSEPPKEIRIFINCINALPKYEKLVDIYNSLSQFVDDQCDENGTIWGVDRETGFKYGEMIFEKLAEIPARYIFDDLSIHDYFQAHNRFSRLLSVYFLFNQIGKQNNLFMHRDWSALPANFDFEETELKLMRSLTYFRDNFTRVRLTVNKDGFIKPEKNELLDTLRRFDIPFERIRLCPICSKIYWAKRVDAKTCSIKCKNNYHQRNLRIIEYEKRLKDTLRKLKKLQSSLNDGNGLISEQEEKIKILEMKIKTEKEKNGYI